MRPWCLQDARQFPVLAQEFFQQFSESPHEWIVRKIALSHWFKYFSWKVANWKQCYCKGFPILRQHCTSILVWNRPLLLLLILRTIRLYWAKLNGFSTKSFRFKKQVVRTYLLLFWRSRSKLCINKNRVKEK